MSGCLFKCEFLLASLTFCNTVGAEGKGGQMKNGKREKRYKGMYKVLKY